MSRQEWKVVFQNANRIVKYKHNKKICTHNIRAYPSRAPEFTHWFLLGPFYSSFIKFFVLSYYVSWHSEFRVVMSVTISAYKGCSDRLYFQLFVGRLMSLCVFCVCFANSDVQHFVYHMSLRSGFGVVLSATMYAWTRCPVRLYLQLFVEGRGSYLRYLCMVVSNRCWLYIVIWRESYVWWGCLPFASPWVHIGVLVGSALLIALGFCVVCFSFVCFRSVSSVPGFFLNCQFLIAHSVFSNVPRYYEVKYIVNFVTALDIKAMVNVILEC